MGCRYEAKNGRCGLIGCYAYRHTCYTRDCCKCWEPPTNADRIRSMNDEELGEFLATHCRVSIQFVKAWLQQPAPEEGRAGMTDRELIQTLTDELAPRIRELCADDKMDCDRLCAGNILTAKCIVFQAAERLAALQAENAELRTQHRTEHCEAAGYDCAELGRLRAALARLETEREMLLEYAEAQMECEMCKNDAFCPAVNPMPENCAVCELKPRCPCNPCKWEWCGAQGEA